jgi:hypothetical protein
MGSPSITPFLDPMEAVEKPRGMTMTMAMATVVAAMKLVSGFQGFTCIGSFSSYNKFLR